MITLYYGCAIPLPDCGWWEEDERVKKSHGADTCCNHADAETHLFMEILVDGQCPKCIASIGYHAYCVIR